MSDKGGADMPPPATNAEEDAAQPAVPLAEAPAAAGTPVKKGAGVKRKVAMFLAYNGHGYQGMQRNPGAKTIEDELFRAIHAAGGISDANSGEDGFAKVGSGFGWGRRPPPRLQRGAPCPERRRLAGGRGSRAHALSCLSPPQTHWMRAARTDKGVSAVGQVVSLRMVVEPEGMVERINAALPDQVSAPAFGT